MRVLVLNCGSSSLKFQIVNPQAASRTAAARAQRPRGVIEGVGDAVTCRFTGGDGREQREQRHVGSHADAVGIALSLLARQPRADAVGHRVVHGGEQFIAATRLDDVAVAAIDALSELAPLHNPAAVSAIRAARAALGDAVPQVAVFDTAFHHRLPDHAAHYALPAALARRHRIRRYGFHGIAHQSLALQYAEMAGAPLESLRLITLQLGNGCSAAAIRDGWSVDTSMGFTPLEGLMMGTRSGDVDASVVAYLARREQVSADTVEDWLNHRSGLLGVSGHSNDMRALLAAIPDDAAARLAVEMFCYRVSKCVGAYLAVLGGADAIIFGGGIGEYAPPIRARVCERLAWCGVHLDTPRNAAAAGGEARISADGSLPVYVIPSDEELLIARETLRCLSP